MLIYFSVKRQNPLSDGKYCANLSDIDTVFLSAILWYNNAKITPSRGAGYRP